MRKPTTEEKRVWDLEMLEIRLLSKRRYLRDAFGSMVESAEGDEEQVIREAGRIMRIESILTTVRCRLGITLHGSELFSAPLEPSL